MKPNFSKINCPECGSSFDLDSALSKELSTEIEKKIKLESEKELQAKLLQSKQEADERLKELSRSVSEKNHELKTLKESELKLLKESKKVREKEENLELEIERKVQEKLKADDQERSKLYQQKIELREKEFQLKEEGLKKKVEELTRQVSQGSQQMQGEVLELVLEDKLRQLFPGDQIAPVEKGIKGADIIQVVNSKLGKNTGSIIWEVKNTKNWSPSWIPKLKEDMRSAKANIAVIVSTALPKDFGSFGQVEGVWITSPSCLEGLATALRNQLLAAHSITQANTGKNKKMEDIYSYLSGDGFRQRVEAIVEAFQTLQTELQKEKAVAARNFAKREKQISQVLHGTLGMYGDLEALLGQDIFEIELVQEHLESEPEQSSLLPSTPSSLTPKRS
jgi:hypothetical protein